jgi:hypothetical protein
LTLVRRRRVLVLVCAALGAACLASSAAAGPPAGLSQSGQVIWNLEALLHDTFGAHDVYLQLAEMGKPEDFTLTDRGDCCSGVYVFTFSNPHGSQFKARHVTSKPRPFIGASGSDVPLTIKGAYIFCGNGRWLYLHEGEGSANWELTCETSG